MRELRHRLVTYVQKYQVYAFSAAIHILQEQRQESKVLLELSSRAGAEECGQAQSGECLIGDKY